MQLQTQPLSLRPFTLYPITLNPIKTCYQSQLNKIICSISGPYYDRTNNIDPTFQIKISSNQNSKIQNGKIQIVQKIRQTLNNVIVKQKYQRMKFDINFDVIQNTNSNLLNLYPPFINLLCYTAVLNGMEIKSLFTCAGLSLLNQKKVTYLPQELVKNNQLNSTKSMVLGIQHLNKQCFMTLWEGDFIFLHYQRLTNILLSCNQQILEFIKDKINQTYDQFN